MFRATQVQQSRRFSRLAAKISADLPRRCQLVYSRPLTSTSAKPITKQVNNNDAFAFILTRLEMVRKQAVRNAAAFERKQAAAKVVSSTPSGIAPTSDVSTLHTPFIQISIGAHSRSKDVRKNALGTTEAVPTALKPSAIAKSKPNSTPSLLQGQAFDSKLNNQVSGLERYARGSVYVGDWLDGKMHGQGKLTCPDGSSYEGTWQQDIRSGTGTATFCYATSPASPAATIRSTTESGNIRGADAVATKFACYTGDWSNDTFYGAGCYTYPDGSTLSGEFVKGKLCNGHGLVRYASSGSARTGEASIYVGDIVDYKRHGQGTFTKDDGTQYIGHWMNNRRSGQGELTYSCGRRMEGSFKSGVLDGRGKLTQSDPALYDYEGCFVQGVPQGDGVQTQRSTGNVYKGSFVSGKRHGYGKFVYGDTNSHVVSLEGIWNENKVVGQGKQVNRNGSIIRGNFKYNKVQGELIYPDGEKFVGLIVTVPPYADTGRGTVRTNNTLYKGELVGGKKQGRGVYTFVTPSEDPLEDAKTQTYTGMFVDNKMHGRGVIACSEGTASGEFKDGVLYTGSGKMYVDNKLQWGRWVEGVRQNFAPAIVSMSGGENDTSAADSDAYSSPTTIVETTNSKNMLQGYYTLQVTPSATITGHFVDNYLVGQGVYSHIRNDRKFIYKGPFLKNKPHGSGVTTNKDGVWQSTYEYGTQKYGMFTSHEGTHKYAGETEGFTFNGKGKFDYPGYTYDGDFKMGVRHGYGVFTKHDVFFYAGNWVDNKRHGYGVNVNKQHTYKGMHYNDLQHGEGELIYNNGYTYKGTFFEGYLTSGVVKTTWGDSHCGEFTRGVRNGKGVFTFSDGVSVNGTWVDGKLQGFATISSPSFNSHSGAENATTDNIATTATSTYVTTTGDIRAKGYFENNVLQYQVTDDDNSTIDNNSAHKLWDILPVLNNDSMFAPMRDFLSEGTTDNLKHGSGQMLFSDGRVYVGVLKNGQMDGTGVLYSGPTGGKTASFGLYTVQGVFRDNKLYNCSGVLMDRGTLFECTWVKGVRQGYAKITQPSQRVLEGEYVDDKFTIAKKNKHKSGKAIKPVESENPHDLPLTRDTVRLKEGRIYSGQLNAGVPHGAGKISNSRGEVWEGEFAHGQLVKGFYSVHSGSENATPSKSESRKIGANKLTLVYKGEFVDSQYHGQGKLMLNDSVYEGSFENGLPHGYGKCVDSDFIYEGEYARGKRHGAGFITLPSGEVREGVWFNDMFQDTAIRPYNGW